MATGNRHDDLAGQISRDSRVVLKSHRVDCTTPCETTENKSSQVTALKKQIALWDERVAPAGSCETSRTRELTRSYPCQVGQGTNEHQQRGKNRSAHQASKEHRGTRALSPTSPLLSLITKSFSFLCVDFRSISKFITSSMFFANWFCTNSLSPVRSETKSTKEATPHCRKRAQKRRIWTTTSRRSREINSAQRSDKGRDKTQKHSQQQTVKNTANSRPEESSKEQKERSLLVEMMVLHGVSTLIFTFVRKCQYKDILNDIDNLSWEDLWSGARTCLIGVKVLPCKMPQLPKTFPR